MRADSLQQELTNAGWKNAGPARHGEWDFDLVGTRMFTFTRWNVLVKMIPSLGTAEVAQWKAIFEAISAASKSWVWGKCFILCIVAGQVSDEVAQQISGDSFGLFGMIRLKGGGGNILIADERRATVYGRVPVLPYDVHKYSKSTHAILTRLVGGSAAQQAGR